MLVRVEIAVQAVFDTYMSSDALLVDCSVGLIHVAGIFADSSQRSRNNLGTYGRLPRNVATSVMKLQGVPTISGLGRLSIVAVQPRVEQLLTPYIDVLESR